MLLARNTRFCVISTLITLSTVDSCTETTAVPNPNHHHGYYPHDPISTAFKILPNPQEQIKALRGPRP